MSECRYRGRVFMYPCANLDIVEPIREFGNQFDTFLFVDIGYQFDRFRLPALPGWDDIDDSAHLEGPAVDHLRTVQYERGHYREITPAWRRSSHRDQHSGHTIDLVFRRGFGQYAVHELNDGTLGMFMHRGDSAGEGGSGTLFLANRRMRHAPLSMLFDAIKSKLETPALIASDGSNTSIRELMAAADGDTDITAFQKFGLAWERSGSLPAHQRRRTTVWRVTPIIADPGREATQDRQRTRT